MSQKLEKKVIDLPLLLFFHLAQSIHPEAIRNNKSNKVTPDKITKKGENTFITPDQEKNGSTTFSQSKSLKSAIVRNAQGLCCPRLKIMKVIVDVPIVSDLPFLVQFELYRLHNQKGNNCLTVKDLDGIVKEKLLDVS